LTAVGREERRYFDCERRRESSSSDEEREEVGNEGESLPARRVKSSDAIPRDAREAIAGAPRIYKRERERSEFRCSSLRTPRGEAIAYFHSLDSIECTLNGINLFPLDNMREEKLINNFD
jgi:hypothetical protein